MVSSPSKFCPGISSLWRGLSLKILNSSLCKIIKTKNHNAFKDSNEFLFSSARSALSFIFYAFNISYGDEVIISSFTCEAVTNAVLASQSKPVYVDILDDLTMDNVSLFKAINKKTKAIIMQNTFGRLGLSKEIIEICKNKNILMIEDNCLSIGSELDGQLLGSFCPLSIWSLEVSKTFTIGWGGVLKVNDDYLLGSLKKKFEEMKRISIFEDFQRIFQLYLSIFFTTFPIKFGFLFWYLLYGFGIFRKSKNEDKIIRNNKGGKVMGILSSKIFYSTKSKFFEIFAKSCQNYNYIDKLASNLDIKKPISKKENEKIVSPRFSFLVREEYQKDVIRIAKEYKIELNRWFFDISPYYYSDSCKLVQNKCAKQIGKEIFNLPVYWTLTKKELLQIEKFLKVVSKYLVKSDE